MSGHPIEALDQVADATRKALAKHPPNSPEAVEAVRRQLADQARKGK